MTPETKQAHRNLPAKPVLENKPRVSGMPRSAMAGAPGFEPRSTAPKAGVLPLHHAPVRRTLYHGDFRGAMSLLFGGVGFQCASDGVRNRGALLTGRQTQFVRL